MTAMTLGGCAAASVPAWTNDPDPVVAPVFASNDEALAAAAATYGEYLAMTDEINHDGGVDSARISHLVTPEHDPVVKSAFADFQSAGEKTLGASSFDTLSLTRYHDDAANRAVVTVYLCADVSGVSVLDAENADVTPAGRGDRFALQISFVSSSQDPIKLLVDEEETWDGKDFC